MRSVRPWVVSTRSRLLLASIGLLALSTLGSIVVGRQVALRQVDARIEEELIQETVEFNRLVGGRDPATGQPFGDDVAAIIDTYLRRNEPASYEAVFTFVNGQPYRGSPGPLEDLYRRQDLVDRWLSVAQRTMGSTTSDAGPVKWVATPIRPPGGGDGVFAVASFTDQERDEVVQANNVAAIAALGVLLVASVLAWAATGRVLAPLRRVTETARRIEESDLSERLEIRGRDEIADLGRTFNAMLDRLELAFAIQRAFVSDAGHELRTPITIIRGHLELMGDDPEERRETIALVTDELDRMNRLVDDLLMLAKAQQPDFLALKPVWLERLTAEVHAKARALGDRDWRLGDTARLEMTLDRQRVTQAWMQLAQNAVQFTAPGGRIEIGSRAEDGQVLLYVEDDGEGISAADQGRIFERFARAGSGRRRSEGSGLGLPIVRAIAEAHGGRVLVESRAGEGSVFALSLPLNARGSASAPTPAPAPAGQTDPGGAS